VVVAVATHTPGFDTMLGLLPPFAFHAVASVTGLQLLRSAARRTESAVAAQAAEAQ
jgi:hypothetical protein